MALNEMATRVAVITYRGHACSPTTPASGRSAAESAHADIAPAAELPAWMNG